MAPNRPPNGPSPQDEPPEGLEASSEEEVDGEEEDESGFEPEVDGEEEEESGSESEEPQPSNAALAEKNPPPKKPDLAMEETPKTKKPRSKASATTAPLARGRSKRPSESDPKGSKRPKKKKIPDSDQEPDHAGGETKKAGGDISKKLVLLQQRIWSDDDEIAILEGMIDYFTKQGVHPSADMFGFHDFMKKSLRADVNKTQLQDKIRRLKKKYETNVAKGKKYNPVKPHELKVFDLSKNLWGISEGPIAFSGLSEQYKCNETCAGLRELEGCLELIGEPKRAELKEEVKKLHVAELELLVRRGELAKLILEALK